MKPHLRYLACGLLIHGTLGFASIGTPPSSTRSETRITTAEFGVYHRAPSGKIRFVPTRTVPHKKGQSYGWIIVLDTPRKTVRWREEFTLPARPASWGAEEKNGSRTLSKDRRTAVTEREVTPNAGQIANQWSVIPGDPKGHHMIRVFVDGVPAAVFEFDVK